MIHKLDIIQGKILSGKELDSWLAIAGPGTGRLCLPMGASMYCTADMWTIWPGLRSLVTI